MLVEYISILNYVYYQKRGKLRMLALFSSEKYLLPSVCYPTGSCIACNCALIHLSRCVYQAAFRVP